MKLNTGLLRRPTVVTLFGGLCTALGGYAQNTPDLGTISGSYQAEAQYYMADSTIGAPEFPQKVGSNSYLNLIYTRGAFSAGTRFEAFYPHLQGFLREEGAGLTYRYVQYASDKIDVTAGTFYEQFGSGMVLRTYEEWGLGFDNSLDGFRAKVSPVKGLRMTGLIGKQRNAFSNKIENLSDGIIRGVDGEWGITETFDSLLGAKTQLYVGGSFVSRYQKDEDPIQVYPENVATYSGRVKLNIGGFSLFSEYAYKINDPSAVNSKIYKPGDGLLVQANYSRKGLGVSLTAKRIDNLDFRSDKNAVGTNLLVNYLPAITRQHTYRLATLFPWATQTTGEMGVQLEVNYRIPKGSMLGGQYGTNIAVNFSRIHGIDKSPSADPDMGYESAWLKTGDLYFQDFNVEVSRKMSSKLKLTGSYLHFNYDKALFKGLTGFNSSENVAASVAIAEVQYKLKPKQTLRTEFQHVFCKNELGNWAMIMAEYTLAPHWFVAFFDEYNYGNADEHKRLNYYTGNVGYTANKFRITAGYGKQRFGVLCVGGVCRLVPASNGFSLSVSGTF